MIFLIFKILCDFVFVKLVVNLLYLFYLTAILFTFYSFLVFFFYYIYVFYNYFICFWDKFKYFEIVKRVFFVFFCLFIFCIFLVNFFVFFVIGFIIFLYIFCVLSENILTFKENVIVYIQILSLDVNLTSDDKVCWIFVFYILKFFLVIFCFFFDIFFFIVDLVCLFLNKFNFEKINSLIFFFKNIKLFIFSDFAYAKKLIRYEPVTYQNVESLGIVRSYNEGVRPIFVSKSELVDFFYIKEHNCYRRIVHEDVPFFYKCPDTRYVNGQYTESNFMNCVKKEKYLVFNYPGHEKKLFFNYPGYEEDLLYLKTLEDKKGTWFVNIYNLRYEVELQNIIEKQKEFNKLSYLDFDFSNFSVKNYCDILTIEYKDLVNFLKDNDLVKKQFEFFVKINEISDLQKYQLNRQTNHSIFYSELCCKIIFVFFEYLQKWVEIFGITDPEILDLLNNKYLILDSILEKIDFFLKHYPFYFSTTSNINFTSIDAWIRRYEWFKRFNFKDYEVDAASNPFLTDMVDFDYLYGLKRSMTLFELSNIQQELVYNQHLVVLECVDFVEQELTKQYELKKRFDNVYVVDIKEKYNSFFALQRIILKIEQEKEKIENFICYVKSNKNTDFFEEDSLNVLYEVLDFYDDLSLFLKKQKLIVRKNLDIMEHFCIINPDLWRSKV